MRRFLLMLPLAVAGCATGPGLASRMAAYTGDSGEILVQSLGVPDKQISLNGVQYLAYVRQRTEIDPGPGFIGGWGGPYGGAWAGPWGGPWGGGFVDAGFPQSVTVWRCETTFTLQHDRVVGFTLRGNDCS